METYNSCCIWKLLGERRDQTTLCKIKGRLNISDKNQKNVELLERRTGYVKNISDKTCHYHEKAYISRYESLTSHKKNFNGTM